MFVKICIMSPELKQKLWWASNPAGLFVHDFAIIAKHGSAVGATESLVLHGLKMAWHLSGPGNKLVRQHYATTNIIEHLS